MSARPKWTEKVRALVKVIIHRQRGTSGGPAREWAGHAGLLTQAEQAQVSRGVRAVQVFAQSALADQ